jgi:GMP synthase (glutamine-hydrolysing)
MSDQDCILIIDFGSQVTQLIARRIREHGVYTVIHPCTMTAEAIRSLAPKGIILSGGPASVTEEFAPTVDAAVFELNVPILGICYGQQWLSKILGGEVLPAKEREYGRAILQVEMISPLFADIESQGTPCEVWMSHGDRVETIPAGFAVIATTPSAPYAAIADHTRHYYGVQFHPEVTHTSIGAALLRNFAINIAKCNPTWTMRHFISEKTAEIQALVGKDHVVCAVSGGVDSTVVAALLHRALGPQLHCIFVGTGLLRQNEEVEVRKRFAEELGIPLIFRDAGEVFLKRLEGIADPEQKRKIIGATFIDIFDEEAKSLGNIAWLAQGTLYPDVIESVSIHGGPSVTIKSHHNVGGLPERMHLKLIEPVRALFKDEVRLLGQELGIPAQMVARHPFPGPGLAIRIPGEVTQEKVALLQAADAIYIEELKSAGLYDKIWQAFAVLLPIRTVGVMGDGRSYDFVCALRAVNSFDGMTADFYPFDMAFLARISTRITNEVRGINRVVYDITSKPPATIEWE